MGDEISYESTENNLPIRNINSISPPIRSRTNDSGDFVDNNESATSMMNLCGVRPTIRIRK